MYAGATLHPSNEHHFGADAPLHASPYSTRHTDRITEAVGTHFGAEASAGEAPVWDATRAVRIG